MPWKRLTEKRILRLKQKLDKVHRLKNEISVLADESREAEALKKKMAEILTLLRSIASFVNPANEEFDSFLTRANLRFVGMDVKDLPWPAIEHEIQFFCDYLNSIVFDLSGKGVRILTAQAKHTGKKRKS
jgi:hypothetical protein